MLDEAVQTLAVVHASESDYVRNTSHLSDLSYTALPSDRTRTHALDGVKLVLTVRFITFDPTVHKFDVRNMNSTILTRLPKRAVDPTLAHGGDRCAQS